MDLSKVFEVFSRRPQPTVPPSKNLSEQFRIRMIKLCQDTFIHLPPFGRDDTVFWREMHQTLVYRHGKTPLSDGRTQTLTNDSIEFLLECGDKEFLDFVELVFKIQYVWEANVDLKQFIDNVNSFFDVDDLPYFLTSYTFPPRPPRNPGDLPFMPGPGIPRIESYPQVIRRDSELMHTTAIEPTLALLSAPIFSAANKEFLEALAHYRSGEFPDCLTKCGSSFESVMKVVCDLKGWSYNQTDTASALLDIVFSHTTLDPFFKQPILLVATIRNRLSGSHGAGTQPRNVAAHVANYALNATAAAILLLVAETNP